MQRYTSESNDRGSRLSAEFHVLPLLPGRTDLYLSSLSHDGRAAAGKAANGLKDHLPVFCSERTGLRCLGTFGGPTGRAATISSDGRIVVGLAATNRTDIVATDERDNRVQYPMRPFLWDGQMHDLADLTDAPNRAPVAASQFSRAIGSADGRAIIGAIGARQETAFIWNRAAGIRRIDSLAGTDICQFTSVSGDGAVVVGVNRDKRFRVVQNILWTAQRGIKPMDTVPVSPDIALSGNGRVAVWTGRSIVGDNEKPDPPVTLAFLPEGRLQHLGPLPPDAQYGLSLGGISFDGAIILGTYMANWPFHRPEPADGYTQIFVWSAATQRMVNLRTALIARTNLAPELKGWSLDEANALSGDGTTIIGTGTDPSGRKRVWRLVGRGGLHQL